VGANIILFSQLHAIVFTVYRDNYVQQ